MEKFHKWISLSLLCALLTTSAHAQELGPEIDDSYSAAYVESSRVAHWSAYIPLTILVVAAIFLGVADKNHSGSSSHSSSDDGLGSLGSRNSSYSNSSNYQYNSSRGGYSH